MKRVLVIVAAGLLAAGSLSAQAWGGRNLGPGQTFQPVAPVQSQELVKVDGKLTLVNGMIAVQAKDKTYYVGGLNRLIGFIDGLKEGANVKLEGYAVQLPMAPEYSHLMVTKLTFNGKDYDLSTGYGYGRGGMMGGAYGGAYGGARGGRGGMMGGRW